MFSLLGPASNIGPRIARRAVIITAMIFSSLAAFLMLCVMCFSVPYTRALYVLYSSQSEGIRFGLWGWCPEGETLCTEKPQLGYTWGTEISNSSATTGLILYPMTSVAVFIFMIASIPSLRSDATKAHKTISKVLATTSFTLSLLAFMIMIAIFGQAKNRFEDAGASAKLGPLPCVSALATLFLGVVCVLTFKVTSSTLESSPDDIRKFNDIESHLTFPPTARRFSKQYGTRKY
ncbi:hypothetical protein FA15DRAFT_694955 [Coprinopsis marcescibilis]|uniref:Uncharacterized protein n=1 Tax=Coprinopsis marcescibilis TaxID=230819 RepID=A0A5C3KUU9_COPMA|nr:hypothetical protein FA15DRAFT_694955 [Coprinopsis marcescibilis]